MKKRGLFLTPERVAKLVKELSEIDAEIIVTKVELKENGSLTIDFISES